MEDWCELVTHVFARYLASEVLQSDGLALHSAQLALVGHIHMVHRPGVLQVLVHSPLHPRGPMLREVRTLRKVFRIEVIRRRRTAVGLT